MTPMVLWLVVRRPLTLSCCVGVHQFIYGSCNFHVSLVHTGPPVVHLAEGRTQAWNVKRHAIVGSRYARRNAGSLVVCSAPNITVTDFNLFGLAYYRPLAWRLV
jgi:hypothetical protein